MTPKPDDAKHVRRPTYWCSSDNGEPIGNLGPDLKHALRCISDELEVWLSEAEDGDEFIFTVGRTDMSPAEEERIPEL